MLMDRAHIARLIPHAGAMCLLDGVLEADAQRILCVAHSHRDRANPLGRDGRLRAACGVEYAAQAIALHGALSHARTQERAAGYLASLRDLRLHAVYLDDAGPELLVEAEHLLGEGANMIYRFAVRAGARTLLEGRAAVVLDASNPLPPTSTA
jgi:predicted hotdog family 3-hydroxylacyl-ACP dehydratase